jgi:ATP-dependent DNA helicase RecG
MAALLQEAGLPEPEFDASNPYRFRVVFHQNPFTEERLRQMGLNERQMRAVAYIREHGKMTNTEYQRIEGVSERTATRDFTTLVQQGVLVALGTKGRGVPTL